MYLLRHWDKSHTLTTSNFITLSFLPQSASHFLRFYMHTKKNSKKKVGREWRTRTNHKEERIHRQILHLTDMLCTVITGKIIYVYCAIEIFFSDATNTETRFVWKIRRNRCGELKMTYLHFQFQHWKRVASDILRVSRR